MEINNWERQRRCWHDKDYERQLIGRPQDGLSESILTMQGGFCPELEIEVVIRQPSGVMWFVSPDLAFRPIIEK